MELIITSTGHEQCIYSEDLPLHELGSLTIRLASYVEPTVDGQWQADLSPVNGPVLGPFGLRSEAIKGEVEWLREWSEDRRKESVLKIFFKINKK